MIFGGNNVKTLGKNIADAKIFPKSKVRQDLRTMKLFSSDLLSFNWASAKTVNKLLKITSIEMESASASCKALLFMWVHLIYLSNKCYAYVFYLF